MNSTKKAKSNSINSIEAETDKCRRQIDVALTESELEKSVEDAKTLESLGVTHEQVADRMRYFMNNEKAKEIRGKYKVKKDWFLGYNDYCPFTHGIQSANFSEREIRENGVVSGCNYTVTNLKTGEKIEFNAAMPHIIRCHQVFAYGKNRSKDGSTQKVLNPEQAVKVLGIKYNN